jgi:hypothetical protein
LSAWTTSQEAKDFGRINQEGKYGIRMHGKQQSQRLLSGYSDLHGQEKYRTLQYRKEEVLFWKIVIHEGMTEEAQSKSLNQRVDQYMLRENKGYFALKLL